MSRKITQLGNPILRERCPEIRESEINSPRIREIVKVLTEMVQSAKYGVGISANQIGERMRISLIATKPTRSRPYAENFSRVLINPEIVETFGRKVGVWEGCLSCGGGENLLYGKVPRYKKVRVKYLDETGKSHSELLVGLPAHVFQHEIDHLNGTVFLDKVSRKSLIAGTEYSKRIVGSKFDNWYDRQRRKNG